MAMTITPIRTKIVRRNNPLPEIIRAALKKIPEGSVVAVTSKVVALSEGRIVRVTSQRERDALVRRESTSRRRSRWGWLTVTQGMVVPNAGIDASNADGVIILLPKDAYRSARKLRTALMRMYRVKRLGILITDSRIMPMRKGTTGIAVGYAGFSGLKNYIGMPDLFGRNLEVTKLNIADTLASAAVLAMGEGAERTPLTLITKPPVRFTGRVHPKELRISPREDLFRPLQ